LKTGGTEEISAAVISLGKSAIFGRLLHSIFLSDALSELKENLSKKTFY
jgi:hypothetical protein